MWRRLKNLWRLSAYRPLGIGEKGSIGDTVGPLIKDFPTIKKKPATIIDLPTVDLFEEEITT